MNIGYINHFNLIINIILDFSKNLWGGGGWGLGVWDLGLGPIPQSPFPNPQSPFLMFNSFKINF